MVLLTGSSSLRSKALSVFSPLAFFPLVAAGLLSGGCAPLKEHLNIEDTTTQATTVGGVMGAGIGALIGSQTGSAGAGLVIGSVAGSGAGYAVGQALEGRNAQLREQEELLERQEQRIAASRRELATLDGANDRSSFGNRRSSSSLSERQAHWGEQRGSHASSSAPSRSYRENSSAEDPSSPYYDRAALRRHQAERNGIVNDKRFGSQARGSHAGAIVSARSPQHYPSAKNISPRSGTPLKTSGENEARIVEQERTGFGTTATLATQRVTQNVGGLEERSLTESSLAASSLGASDMGESDLTGSSVVKSAPIEINAADESARNSSNTHASVTSSVAASPVVIGKVGAITTGTTSADIATESTGVSTRDDDCILADREISASQKAIPPADKLFHQRKALRLCPNQPDYHVELARTYQMLNRTSDAVYELRAALRMNPQHTGALALLKEVE